MRQIVLDTETTGLAPEKGHRIIEVAGVELINRKLTGRHYHEYICPEREIEAGAFAVHGISQEFLANKPVFAKVSASLIEFIEDAELIIHNAPFDVAFLDSEFSRLNLGTVNQRCRILDTLVLARKKHPGQQNSLDALCKRYSIDLSARKLHGALLDAELLASVYLAMTGGQTSLFGEAEIEPSSKQTIFAVESISYSAVTNLKVILASSEELQSHQAQLEMIEKASEGNCLWARNTDNAQVN